MYFNYGTNITKDIKEAVNSGKLNKETYSQLNKRLDQVSQYENTQDLLKHAQELDEILELSDTDNSLAKNVEELAKEAKLDNENYSKLKDMFNQLDNQIPYVAETSENKKIDVFRDDMILIL